MNVNLFRFSYLAWIASQVFFLVIFILQSTICLYKGTRYFPVSNSMITVKIRSGMEFLFVSTLRDGKRSIYTRDSLDLELDPDLRFRVDGNNIQL